MWTHLGRLRIGALVALVAVAIAAPALAAVTAKPKKGKTYSGEIRKTEDGVKSTVPISFRVSKTGKSVSKFKFNSGPPFYCQGGGFEAKSTTARISSKGAFTAKMAIIFRPTGKKFGTLKVTGKFGRGGHESGKAITGGFKLKSCDGSSPYSTTAQ